MTDSKEIDDGGPAFSVCFEGGQNNGDSPYFHEGMSLRDYFAALSISAVIENCKGDTRHPGEKQTDYFARTAYEVADAMIAARRASPLPADNGRAE